VGGSAVFAFTCALACGGTSESKTSGVAGSMPAAGTGGTGGTTGGTGGTTGGTGGTIEILPDCPAFTPCGGDIVGVWRLESICGAVTSSSNETSCVGQTVVESLAGNAIYTFGVDGTATVTGNLSIVGDISVTDACAQSMGTTAAAYCEVLSAAAGGTGSLGGAGGTGGAGAAAGTGGTAGSAGTGDPAIDISCMLSASQCDCHLEEGPILVESTATYVTMGTQVIVDGTPSDYCVEGSTLTVSGTTSTGTALSIFTRN